MLSFVTSFTTLSFWPFPHFLITALFAALYSKIQPYPFWHCQNFFFTSKPLNCYVLGHVPIFALKRLLQCLLTILSFIALKLSDHLSAWRILLFQKHETSLWYWACNQCQLHTDRYGFKQLPCEEADAMASSQGSCFNQHIRWLIPYLQN